MWYARRVRLAQEKMKMNKPVLQFQGMSLWEIVYRSPRKLQRLEPTQTQKLFFSFACCLSYLPASSTSVSAMALILDISASGTHQFSQCLFRYCCQPRPLHCLSAGSQVHIMSLSLCLSTLVLLSQLALPSVDATHASRSCQVLDEQRRDYPPVVLRKVQIYIRHKKAWVRCMQQRML